jgi:hypothetical protein
VATTYFVLDADQSVPIVGHVEDQNTTELANKFTRGHLLSPDERPRDLTIRVELGPETYPDLFMLQRTPIVSDEFLSRLRTTGIDNFETFPATIIELPREGRERGREISGHYVLNVIGRVSCLDMAASDLNMFRKKVFRVNRLALDTSKTDDLLLFRVHEFELLVLLSQHAAKALGGLSGVLVAPAEGWSDSSWY